LAATDGFTPSEAVSNDDDCDSSAAATTNNLTFIFLPINIFIFNILYILL